MDVVVALLNSALVAFVVATMLSAGLRTEIAALVGVLRNARTTTALIAPTRNAGPAFAAIAVAFDNDPAVLAAASGILLMGLAVELPVAARLARRRTTGEEYAAARAAAQDAGFVELGRPGPRNGPPDPTPCGADPSRRSRWATQPIRPRRGNRTTGSRWPTSAPSWPGSERPWD